MEAWENDHLCLQLNYDQCFSRGKHIQTSNKDWLLFIEAVKSDYSEQMYVRLVQRLLERDGYVRVIKSD